MKRTQNYAIWIGNKGSVLASDVKVFKTKLFFEPIFTFDMIWEWFSSNVHILRWNKSIKSRKEIMTFSKNIDIIHTVYGESFIMGERDFIEKTDRQMLPSKLLIYTSSVPVSFLPHHECKVHGTTIFNLTVIKYSEKKERTSVTIYEQIRYGTKTFEPRESNPTE